MRSAEVDKQKGDEMSFFDFSDLIEPEKDYPRKVADFLIRRANERFTRLKCGEPVEEVDYRTLARATVSFVSAKREVKKSYLNY